MPFCIDCGNQLDFEESVRCDSCKGVIVNRAMQPLRTRLDEGKPIFLYRSVYIPVDSGIDDKNVVERFDICPLQELGLAGWDIVEVVPRTVALTLENRYVGMSYKTYAGAISGIVAGVHVLLKREIRQPLTEETERELFGVLCNTVAIAA